MKNSGEKPRKYGDMPKKKKELSGLEGFDEYQADLPQVNQRRVGAAMLTGACLAGASSVIAQGDGSAAAEFDENNIVLSFSTISDTHIQGGTSSLSASKSKRRWRSWANAIRMRSLSTATSPITGQRRRSPTCAIFLDYSSGKGRST